MKPAALGFRMHSGWGVLVAVIAGTGALQVIGRWRIVIVDPDTEEARMPYHHAAELAPPAARKYLTDGAAIAARLALAAVDDMVRECEAQQARIVAAAVLRASGRPLPALEKILASHPLIHTAEGEFFRHAVRRACETRKIPVTDMVERELPERAKAVFGKAAGRVQDEIAAFGKSLGPPWTADHKVASLAAAILLAGNGKGER